MGVIEKTYGGIFKGIMYFINAFKKKILIPQCRVHQFINLQAVEILKNEGYEDAYSFFSDHMVSLNAGVVWADQDLKNTGHFYNPVLQRGLYGNRDALSLALEYYNLGMIFWRNGDVEPAVFYMGACAHLLQDMTVPHHANIRLLDNHRAYETYVIQNYRYKHRFKVEKGIYYYPTVEEYIRCNARTSLLIYKRLGKIKPETKMFYIITKFNLPLAQKSTAGFLLKCYRDMGKRDWKPEKRTRETGKIKVPAKFRHTN